MNEDLKEIEKTIETLLEVEDIKEYEKNNEQKYKDYIHILEEYSKALADKTETYNEKELEWLDKLLDKLADKHDELKDKVAEIKTEVQVIVSSKQLTEDINKLMGENDLEEIQTKSNGEYEKLIGRIIDNFSFIKENAKEDSVSMYLAFKQARELMNKHKGLKNMCEDLLYSKVNKEIEIDTLKKQREEMIENQAKNDKLESNIKTLNTEILYYFKNNGFDLNKYKDFVDKLEEYDKELYKLKETMSAEQYNRILEEYYKTDANLQTLYPNIMKEVEEEKGKSR